MLRLLKIFLWMVGCWAIGIQSAHSFSLLGPGPAGGQAGDSWQTPDIGYGFGGSGQIGQPKNIGEEYRWNIPVLYYACDVNFVQYFGSNGVAAIDSAFAILNNAFTNGPTALTNGVDGFNSDLSEFPTQAKDVNFLAQGLFLLDIKSVMLQNMVRELGLTDPDRYVWTLRARSQITPGPTCPDGMNYLVVQRNFDPITFTPSSYVNGTLYSYVIDETCKPPNPLALAVPFPVDPLASVSTAVASENLAVGEFYTGLTYDDAGGLKYLLRTNNINREDPGPGTTVLTLVTNDLTQITTLNLAGFLQAELTNGPAALLALFPNLHITGVSSNLVLVNQTNFTGFVFTNLPWLPAGFPPQILSEQQVVQQFALQFSYTFDNVVTNHFFTNLPTLFQTVTITPDPFGIAGSGAVKTSISTVKTFGPGGDFFILPPGVIGYVFTGQVITNVTAVTNVGNFVVINANKIAVNQTVTFFTNYTFVVRPIVLQTATSQNDLYQGIEKITFVRRDFDSLIGNTWVPLTNSYTLTSLANGSLIPHPVRRVVAQPDILITASDIPPFIVGGTIFPQTGTLSTPNYDTANILPNLAGPGTLTPQVVIAFTTEAPVFYNTSAFLGQPLLPAIIFGSFDGTTNAPVVYPDGTSLLNLENQILMQITTTTLPIGTNGVPYNGGAGFQLTGSGGSPPYTWDIVNNALPPGLSLSSSGLISGTPVSAATFDFTVRMTDIGARSVQQDFSITIHP